MLNDNRCAKRELRNTFIRINTLVKKFKYCSLPVKTLLFKSYCLCFYDLALWSCFYAYNLAKFRSCYNRCAKKFFGYKRQDSLSEMHIICNIPSFDTVIHNANLIFKRCCLESCNSLVKLFIWHIRAKFTICKELLTLSTPAIHTFGEFCLWIFVLVWIWSIFAFSQHVRGSRACWLNVVMLRSWTGTEICI